MHTFIGKPKAGRRTSSAMPRAVNGVSSLQHKVSHQAVQRIPRTDTAAGGSRQTKLSIDGPGDGYEHDAERVAEQVMRTPELPGLSQASLHAKRVQAGDTGNIAAPPSVHDALHSPGQPLDSATRALMEPRFGFDFSRVRLHSGAAAERSTQNVNALAYTVGNDIVFGAGRLSPGTQEGRRLIAHELTHVLQQSGSALAVQRQPSPQPAPDPAAERAAAAAEAEVIARTPMWYHEQQWEAEDRLGLKATKRKDKEYASSLAGKDKARIRRSGQLTPEHQSEIAVTFRFFQGEAKAAYLRMIAPIVSEVAEPEQVQEILAGPPQEVTCDVTNREYVLEYEGDPSKSRCMQVPEDPEYKNLFDDDIKDAVGYSVEGTTWENVAPDRFKIMLVNYKNGTSEFFILDAVGNFHYSALPHVAPLPTFLKRENGLIYPVDAGRIAFSEIFTPNIISLKEGLKWQITQLQDLYGVLQLGGAYAGIVAAYGIPAGFMTSLQAPKRTTAGLPGGRKSGSGSRTSTSSGVPDPITDEATTQRMQPGARVAEVVGDYEIAGDKGLVGDTFRRDIYGLFRTAGKTNDTRPIMNLARDFIAEAKAAGAKRLLIVGHVVRNKNVLGISRLAKRFGGEVTVTRSDSIEIVIPVE